MRKKTADGAERWAFQAAAACGAAAGQSNEFCPSFSAWFSLWSHCRPDVFPDAYEEPAALARRTARE